MNKLTMLLAVCVLFGTMPGCSKSSTAAAPAAATVTGVATASKVAVVSAN